MAGNFWRSTHFRYFLPQSNDDAPLIGASELKDTDRDRLLLSAYLADLAMFLGSILKAHHKVIFTSIAYVKRYLKTGTHTGAGPLNFVLLVITAILLASKVEHYQRNLAFPERLVESLVSEVRSLEKNGYKAVAAAHAGGAGNSAAGSHHAEITHPSLPGENMCKLHTEQLQKFLEPLGVGSHGTCVDAINSCEADLVERLKFLLIVYHPHRSLIQYMKDAWRNSTEDDFNMAWAICNDSHRTDLSMRYPPYRIALACVLIVGIMKKYMVESWFDEINDDKRQIERIAQEIVTMYEITNAVAETASETYSAVLERASSNFSALSSAAPVVPNPAAALSGSGGGSRNPSSGKRPYPGQVEQRAPPAQSLPSVPGTLASLRPQGQSQPPQSQQPPHHHHHQHHQHQHQHQSQNHSQHQSQHHHAPNHAPNHSSQQQHHSSSSSQHPQSQARLAHTNPHPNPQQESDPNKRAKHH